jgi:hypothetical protein
MKEVTNSCHSQKIITYLATQCSRFGRQAIEAASNPNKYASKNAQTMKIVMGVSDELWKPNVNEKLLPGYQLLTAHVRHLAIGTVLIHSQTSKNLGYSKR